MKDLPKDLQLAPIFSFQKLNNAGKPNQYLCGGNFFDVIPYEGRYDAQPLGIFTGDGKNNLRYAPQSNLLKLNAQVRDIKRLRSAKHGDVLVVAPNDDSLLFYKVNNK